MALTKTPIELSSTPGIVDNSNATAITINSSENVLVEKTASNTATVGHELRTNGVVTHTSGAVATLYLNRTTSDGDIAVFRKDNTTVGSIGTKSSLLTIGTGTTGLIFDSAQIYPWNTNTNAAIDASKDLGASGARFKDLYLSGGAYLGGTAAANKLEDYEEGTWTGSPTAGASSALTVDDEKYTKIGNQVTIACTINFAGASGGLSVAGLPFAAATLAGVGIGREDASSGYAVYGRAAPGSATFSIYYAGATGNATPFQVSAGNMRFSMTYII